MVIKKLINPLQFWLLSRGRCVGCGAVLPKTGQTFKQDEEKSVCKCGRIFIFDKKTQKYRRAALSEV